VKQQKLEQAVDNLRSVMISIATSIDYCELFSLLSLLFTLLSLSYISPLFLCRVRTKRSYRYTYDEIVRIHAHKDTKEKALETVSYEGSLFSLWSAFP